MARGMKYQKQVEAERASNLRILINAQLKTIKTDAERETLKSLKEALKGRRKLSNDEYNYIKAELKQINQTIIKQEKAIWRQKQKQLAFERDQRIEARKQQKKKKKEQEQEQNVDYGKYGAEKYHKDYTGEDLEELRLNFLGIGKNGIKLSDNTIFTEDDFKQALEKNNISLDRFFDTEMDILNIKYNPTRYNRWKQSIESELKRLIDSENLTPREKEGIERMTKMYGIFNSVRSEIY